jgi:ceramide glucosyltransferase
MHALTLALVLTSTAWTLLGAIAVAFVTRRRRAGTHVTAPRPVTILKPLCGADASLAENLESFFVQDHPHCEILFGVEDAADPAVAVAASLIRRYPDRRARLVVHALRNGTNPKVRNLRGMIPHAEHDLVLVSDSSVRVPPHYVSELAREYAKGDRVGLVTNLIRGREEDGIGAALESVQLAGFCAAGVSGPTLVGDALVVGKSMLFSRSRLEALGGLESVSNVLAEDYVMGKMFQHAGFSVRIAPTVVDNITTGSTLASFLGRQRRWAMLRWRLRPVAYVLEPLTSPLAVLPAAWVLLGPWAIAWAGVLLFTRDVGQWLLMSGPRRAWLPLLLSPVREAAALVVWLRAPFCRHVAWRGHRVRLSAGSVAYVARSRRSGMLNPSSAL